MNTNSSSNSTSTNEHQPIGYLSPGLSSTFVRCLKQDLKNLCSTCASPWPSLCVLRLACCSMHRSLACFWL